ncbi:lysozyme inhibitor LprI family protein [Stutzerimonas kunmingensis]|uniref:lysozyme inhibitor LprI family protein n=1 Tax=Stutzerimonas kunmingensis TaxID=1211807 RepID=UPI0037D00707
MNRKSAAIFILAGAFAGVAHAASMKESICNSASNEGEMYQCLKHQFNKADATLNQSYKTLVARYKNNGIQQAQGAKPQDSYLKEAQIAWIKFRDESCDFETYEAITGSGFGTIYTACLLGKTLERVKYLQWYVEHP